MWRLFPEQRQGKGDANRLSELEHNVTAQGLFLGATKTFHTFVCWDVCASVSGKSERFK